MDIPQSIMMRLLKSFTSEQIHTMSYDDIQDTIKQLSDIEYWYEVQKYKFPDTLKSHCQNCGSSLVLNICEYAEGDDSISQTYICYCGCGYVTTIEQDVFVGVFKLQIGFESHCDFNDSASLF